MKNLILTAFLVGCGAAEPAHEASEHPAGGGAPPVVEEAPGPAEPDVDPRRACAATAECVLVEATCGGSIGVNAGHAAAFAEEQLNARAYTTCLVGPPVPPPSHPECVEAVCTAVLDELPTAES